MNMKEIYATKGIEVGGYRSADEENAREGVIRKVMKIWSPSDWGKGNYAIVGVKVDTFSDIIDIAYLDGTDPLAKNLFWALLADRDVRRLIKKYQEKDRVRSYKIWSTTGMSGREDVFMTFGEDVEGFNRKKTMKLCHISGFGRLNEGFDTIYVGDFVELCVYLGLTDDMSVDGLRKKAGVKYLRPKFSEELQEYTTDVSKIL